MTFNIRRYTLRPEVYQLFQWSGNAEDYESYCSIIGITSFSELQENGDITINDIYSVTVNPGDWMRPGFFAGVTPNSEIDNQVSVLGQEVIGSGPFSYQVVVENNG